MGKRHGHHNSLEYHSWQGMRQRCLNPRHVSYADYGGRGITVCEQWADFSIFLADLGFKPSPRHSIDRVDNDGNYEPSNCRWATVRVTPSAEWAGLTGIRRGTIIQRLRYGIDPLTGVRDGGGRKGRRRVNKLSDQDVRDIRALPKGLTQREIAERYGVNPTCISCVLRGKGYPIKEKANG